MITFFWKFCNHSNTWCLFWLLWWIMHKELNRTWQELNSIWLELPQTCLWFSLANESLELSSVSHGTWNSRRESFHFLSNGSDRQVNKMKSLRNLDSVMKEASWLIQLHIWYQKFQRLGGDYGQFCFYELRRKSPKRRIFLNWRCSWRL